jgi:hypothetical protein
MVIDDVEQNREAKTMGRIHEPAEIVRRTIGPRGREEASDHANDRGSMTADGPWTPWG